MQSWCGTRLVDGTAAEEPGERLSWDLGPVFPVPPPAAGLPAFTLSARQGPAHSKRLANGAVDRQLAERTSHLDLARAPSYLLPCFTEHLAPTDTQYILLVYYVFSIRMKDP